MRWSKCLPTAYFALSRLSCGETYMDRLLNCLKNYLLWQTKSSADPRGLCRAQMSDVVDSMRVKAHRLYQINLNLVTRGDTGDEIFPGFFHRLCYSKDWRDVIAWMRIIRGKKSIMHVQFANSRAVRPSSPLRTKTLFCRNP